MPRRAGKDGHASTDLPLGTKGTRGDPDHDADPDITESTGTARDATVTHTTRPPETAYPVPAGFRHSGT